MRYSGLRQVEEDRTKLTSFFLIRACPVLFCVEFIWISFLRVSSLRFQCS
jgi:hypothetical protein